MGVFWLPHVPTRGAGKMAEIAGLSRFLDDRHFQSAYMMEISTREAEADMGIERLRNKDSPRFSKQNAYGSKFFRQRGSFEAFQPVIDEERLVTSLDRVFRRALHGRVSWFR